MVGMRDGIDCRIAPVFTVDQLAARSNFGSSGRQLFCACLRLPLIGQSKIIRRTRAAITRSDPHTCCEQNVITRLKTQLSHAAALRLRLSNSFSWAVTTSSTMVVRSGLATGAGLEPAPPACAGALAVKLPCICASPAAGSGNLDMSDGAPDASKRPLCPTGQYIRNPRRGPSVCPTRQYGVSDQTIRESVSARLARAPRPPLF